ncbi:hypothetical protein M0R72_21345 [Candidatus Pacearchaeota archaeon]|nr:hypothetical protein [Candidatus Pacearchaeota archaeon]
MKKAIEDKARQRTLTFPPEIDDFLDTIPDGQRSAWVMDAIRIKREMV